jgi:hypothetical protein
MDGEGREKKNKIEKAKQNWKQMVNFTSALGGF